MAVRTIKVPDIGEGIAEVEVVAWHVKPGDRVAEDQNLAEVMTDKAAVEVPSPVAGTVVALGGEVGQMLAVGGELVRIDVGGGAEVPAVAAPPAAPAAEPVAAPAVAPTPPAPSTGAAAPTRPMATVTPQAQVPQMPQLPARAFAPADAAPMRSAEGPGTDRPIASPSVRRRAWELGVDLGAVVATGPAGRVTHADVEARAASHPAAPTRPVAMPLAPPPAPAAAPSVAPTAPTAPPTVALRTSVEPAAPQRAAAPAARSERNDEEKIPVIGLRRRIAVKMQESKRRIPHYSYVEEVDVTEVEALRAQLNAKWGEQRPRLTLLPLLVRAIVLAVREHPVVNARFDDEVGVITRYGAVHLGIATQTPSGLLVPVLTHAEARDLWSTAAEVARLAEVARAGRATRTELSGSTLTITSLGALGGIATTPVINHPEVAIVGVNRIVERPMLRGGLVVARQLMNLSSSFDHRVVDGIDAARFVQSVRGYLESPATMFVE
ncbi:MAG TPA: dihydrolipoamide acetyltransferase family protein [Burkholderiaceae bacterium]|nr:dihydrolipoamide acetyltransferase family protein [Burkholderiaceae bacterium]